MTTKFNPSQLNALLAALSDLSTKEVEEDFTKRQLIQKLAPKITEMQKLGYSNNQIIDVLNAGGLGLTRSSFNSYLSSAKRKKTKTRSKPEATQTPSASE